MEAIRNEIAKNYRTLAEIRENTETPSEAVAQFVERVGYAAAVETIAAAINCKAWDGRISDKNRAWAAEATTEGGNNVYIIGIDRIHPAHLDQLAHYMRRYEPTPEAPAEEPKQETENTKPNGYTITNTSAAGRCSCEVYFESMPAAEVREALKAEGFRWHRVKKCWYGYTDSTTAAAIIEAAKEDGAPLREGEKAPKESKTATAGTPQNRIKFYYNGLRLNGSKELTKCGYYTREDGSISIYADGYGAELPRDLFDVKNDTDIYTDYFDKDSATVTAAHPLYKFVKFAALKATAHDLKHQADHYAKRAGARGVSPSAAAWYKKEAAAAAERLANLEKMADPGQPTAEDLAKIDQARQEAENRRREEEHAAQLAERERVLNERAEGRRYIEAVAEAHPIEEGAPVVEIPFSENPAFYFWTESTDRTRTEIIINADGSREESTIIEEPRRRCLLSVAAADIVLKHFDEKRHAENIAQNRGGYDKTDFIISWTDESGEPWQYSGRYDLGDNDGGMIAHIEALAEWDRTHTLFGKPTTEPQPISAERLAWVELLKKYNRAA